MTDCQIKKIYASVEMLPTVVVDNYLPSFAHYELIKSLSLFTVIDVGGVSGASPILSLTPGYTTTLTCNIIAQTGAVIIYTWTSLVESEAEVKTRVLTLSPRENVQNGDTEEITCEGSVGEFS